MNDIRRFVTGIATGKQVVHGRIHLVDNDDRDSIARSQDVARRECAAGLARLSTQDPREVRYSAVLALAVLSREDAVTVAELAARDGSQTMTRRQVIHIQAIGKINRDVTPILLTAMKRRHNQAAMYRPAVISHAALS